MALKFRGIQVSSQSVVCACALQTNKKIGKSHIDLDDLLGEGDLPIQESIIIRKSAEKFLLSTQKEIAIVKIFKLFFYFLFLFFFCFFFLLSLVFLSILLRSMLFRVQQQKMKFFKKNVCRQMTVAVFFFSLLFLFLVYQFINTQSHTKSHNTSVYI